MIKTKNLWLLGVLVVAAFLGSLYTNMSRSLLVTHLNIYLSPTGSDTNDGLTPQTPLKTLNRAHALAAARLKSSQPTDIEINVAPGVYYNQSVTWTAVHPDYYVIIKSSHPTNRPVFDGRLDAGQSLGEKRSFFVMKHEKGMSNLSFERIAVKYYVEAITFTGDRENFASGYNGNNKVFNSLFDRIGSRYSKDKSKPGYAVVRFSNSRFNQVKGNVFSNIANDRSDGLLHALYISSASSYNVIEGNAFRANQSDAVRIRDYSNFNKISKNEYDKAGAYGYSEWYCEKRIESACTKAVPECPSWGNEFRDNVLKGVGTFKLYINPSYVASRSACKSPIPEASEGKRVATSGNISNSTSQLVTTNFNGSFYYAFCPNLNHCVNSTQRCYADAKGTSRWLCSNKNWYSCASDKDVGVVRSGVKCTRSGNVYSWTY